MKERKNPLRSVKVVFRPSPASLKIALILLILFSMAALLALRWVHNSIRAETEKLQAEAAAIGYANEEIERKQQEIGTFKWILETAKEELGLVDPNTVIIDPQS